MALTKTPIELSSTPSIVDGGNATAITIDSSENTTFAGTVTSGSHITIPATSRLYLDGGGNSFIEETAADPVTIPTGNTEAMRIDSNQAVGINMNPNGYGQLSVNSTGVILALRASSGAGQLGFYEGGSGRFYFKTLNGSSGLSFIDGNGSTELGRFDGNGLKFNGDTAADNALDDYEEGTWTPTIASDASPSSYHYQVGYFTKIGRQVHVTGQLRVSNMGSMSGATTNIGGLPFNIANITTYDPRGIIGLKGAATAKNEVFCRGIANNSYVRVEANNGATADDRNMNANAIDTDTIVYIDLSYIVG